MPETPVIVAACRTPIGKYLGGLSSLSATDLGAVVLEEVVKRAGIEKAAVEEVIMGNVLSAGLGQNPARQAALKADFPVEGAALTINKVCGSGLKAVMLAAQAIKAGDRHVVLAGGMESMSNAPHMLLGSRNGIRLGDGTLKDHMVHDGLWDHTNGYHMGETGEIVAERNNVSREDADALSAASHAKAVAAQSAGTFDDEIVPVSVPQRKGDPVVVSADEGVRPSSTAEALAGLRPVFRKDGQVTAGNASQLSDGASALLVTSQSYAQEHNLPILAVVEHYDTSGVAPEFIMEAPIVSVQNLFERTGLTIDDIDLFEHNEAFASASCAVRAKVAVPDEKFNVNGGAVALGHPIGASGARILTGLIYELHRRGGKRGLATLCLGGGNAVTMTITVPE